MEDINSQSNVLKKRVILHSLCHGTVVVKEDVIWFDVFMKCTLYHLLTPASQQSNSDPKLEGHITMTLPHPSAP